MSLLLEDTKISKDLGYQWVLLSQIAANHDKDTIKLGALDYYSSILTDRKKVPHKFISLDRLSSR